MKISILLVLATSLVADGGGVLTQKSMSGLRVTVLANPFPMSTGQEQIAVLVENERDAAPVPDARVVIRARSPERLVQELEATRSQAQDGWYNVRPQLPTAGTWGLEVVVERRGVRAEIPVQASVQNSGRTIGDFMPLIALAPVGAILFVFNRVLRGRSGLADSS